ncbi:hypothetical protein BGW42_004117 [Actinomortierella wolfii]|nr:hypothetical protein BGW42_004117 [Actinomortierella wolfii]
MDTAPTPYTLEPVIKLNTTEKALEQSDMVDGDQSIVKSIALHSTPHQASESVNNEDVKAVHEVAENTVADIQACAALVDDIANECASGNGEKEDDAHDSETDMGEANDDSIDDIACSESSSPSGSDPSIGATNDVADQSSPIEEAPAENAIEEEQLDEEELSHLQAFECKMQFFRKSQFAPSASTEDLPQICENAPSNATTVIKTVNFIVANQSRVKRLDASVVSEALVILNRLLEAHERFQLICLSGDEESTLKALHCLLNETMADHQELARGWAVTYHSIQEVGQTLAAKLQATNKTNLFSLFKNKVAGSLSNEECEHWIGALGQAANDWQVMMDNMVPQWKAYKHFARQMNRFAIVVETESIGERVDGFLRQVYKEARTSFRNSVKLSQLHHQIDYTAIFKEVPKENANATIADNDEQDSKTQQQTTEDVQNRYLFAYDVLKKRRHILHGTLTEHASMAATPAHGKKAPPASPRQIDLILTTDLVYIGSRVPTSSNDGKKPEGSIHPKAIKILHEPVALADTQISCPPDTPGNENVVIVCFHNTTTYILQAKNPQERDTWMRVAHQFNLDRPRQSTDTSLDHGTSLSTSTGTLAPSSNQQSGGSGVRSLFQRLKSVRRHSIPANSSSTTSLNELGQSDNKQREEPGIRRLPADHGTIPPAPLHIHLRASVIVERNVQVVDLTTGKTTICEFGLARENYQVNDRVDSGFLMATLPAIKATQEEYFAVNGQGFVAAPYNLNEPSTYYHQLKPEDILVTTWIHPGLDIQFQPDMVTISLANMYKFIFDTPETVVRLQEHYHQLLMEQIQAPDNLFLTMPFRSQAVQVAKRISRGFTTANGIQERLEMGRCHIEFRKMSNHPGALSVGFWNPKTRRDMSLGVCPLNLMLINTASAWTSTTSGGAKPASNGSSVSPTTPNSAQSVVSTASALNAAWSAGPVKMQQLITRETATELQFRLIQADVVIKRRAQGGKIVLTTRDSSSLDTYYVQGTREALNEFEEFLRESLGVACTAPSIEETLRLAQMAFDEDVMASVEDDSDSDQETESISTSSKASSPVKSVASVESDEHIDESTEEASPSDLPSHGHVAKLIKNLNLANNETPRPYLPRSSKTSSKNLTPVTEELEAEDSIHSQRSPESCSESPEDEDDETRSNSDIDADAENDTERLPENEVESKARRNSALLDRASFSTSFQFKSTEALKHAADEAGDAESPVEERQQDLDSLGGVLEIDSSSFGDLTVDTLLSSFLIPSSDEDTQSPEKDMEEVSKKPSDVISGTAESAPGYVQVGGFKLRNSKSNLPAQCPPRSPSPSTTSSALSALPPLQQQQPQQQREREQGSNGSNSSLHEPKSVADLARLWGGTTSAGIKLNRSGASNFSMNNKRRSESSATLESPRTAFGFEHQHQYQYQLQQKRASFSTASGESAVLTSALEQLRSVTLPNRASLKTASNLSMASESLCNAQSHSKLLRQSQKLEAGVESVPHQPVRELKAHWESLGREGI